MYRGRAAVLVGIVAIAVAAIAAGCGDSSEAALSKAQYVTKANQICKKGIAKKNSLTEIAVREELKGLKNPSELELSKAEEERLVKSVALPPVAAAIEELAELPAPDGDEEKVEKFVVGFEKAIDETEADPSVVLQGLEDPFREPNKLAKEYGLPRCREF